MNHYERKATLEIITKAREAFEAYRGASEAMRDALAKSSLEHARVLDASVKVAACEAAQDGEGRDVLASLGHWLEMLERAASTAFADVAAWERTSTETVRGIPAADIAPAPAYVSVASPAYSAQGAELQTAYHHALATCAVPGDGARGHVCCLDQSDRTLPARRRHARSVVWRAQLGGLTLSFPGSRCTGATLDVWGRDAAEQIHRYAASRGLDAYTGEIARKSA